MSEGVTVGHPEKWSYARRVRWQESGPDARQRRRSAAWAGRRRERPGRHRSEDTASRNPSGLANPFASYRAAAQAGGKKL